ARVLHEPRRGYGRACATGLGGAHGDVVVFLDGDAADDPAQIPILLASISSGEADVVLGSRLAGEMQPGARLYGLRLTDLGTFRAVRRQALLELDMQEMTYGWPTEMIVKAARRGLRVIEVPVRYRARQGGRSKISGTVRGTVLAAYHILGTVLRFARWRWPIRRL
ncbi:MAG: glycosyltransferase, partial [Anaerolineae bacterium]|nr:glycosyltransferase [Anaerolineae bacterium]